MIKLNKWPFVTEETLMNLDLTVAPHKPTSRIGRGYYRSVACLDMYGNGDSLPVCILVSFLSGWLWLFLIAKPKLTPGVLYAHSGVIELLTMLSLEVACMFATFAMLALVIMSFSWFARRSGKIVRIDPAVVKMWHVVLYNNGLDKQESKITRWLARNQAPALVAANKTWLDGRGTPHNMSGLSSTLDGLAHSYNKQTVITTIVR
jgi:hypothetical protein